VIAPAVIVAPFTPAAPPVPFEEPPKGTPAGPPDDEDVDEPPDDVLAAPLDVLDVPDEPPPDDVDDPPADVLVEPPLDPPESSELVQP
jgi:hypothetical protein